MYTRRDTLYGENVQTNVVALFASQLGNHGRNTLSPQYWELAATREGVKLNSRGMQAKDHDMDMNSQIRAEPFNGMQTHVARAEPSPHDVQAHAMQ